MEKLKLLWLPEEASTFANSVDNVFLGYMFFSWIVLTGIILVMVIFGYKYRRKSPDQLATSQKHSHLKLEVAWTIIPTVIFMLLFCWGYVDFIKENVPPEDAMEINVSGQKWSWEFTYPNGAQEDILVVPLGQPVKLLMTSRDVIHSFAVPEFRIKKDVVPNMFTTLWFEANKIGDYKVFCMEFCGTKHSKMISDVKVMDPDDYKSWVKNAMDASEGLTPEEYGKVLYSKKACKACHTLDGTRSSGPSWKGIFGTDKKLIDGQIVKADENYLRKAIEDPMAEIVDTYQPVMPPYKGVLSDKEILSIIAYIKSLK